MVVYKSVKAAVRAARATEYVIEVGGGRYQVADGVEAAFRVATGAYKGPGHGAFAEAKDDLWEMLRGWDSVDVPVVTEAGGWWTVQAYQPRAVTAGSRRASSSWDESAHYRAAEAAYGGE